MSKATKSNQKLFGEIGENYAARLLKKNGYIIIDKNFRTKVGEIDIVAVDPSVKATTELGRTSSGQGGDTLVFVEVKTRRSKKYGRPEEAVTPKKLKKIIKAGQIYVKLNSNLPQKLRVDIVAIEVWGDKVTSAKIIKVV